MKKLAIFLTLALFSLNAHAFWIWSPKTQKWKNPNYSPLVTPYLQYKEAERTFEKKDYDRAFKEFRKVLIHYPDSKEAADAQYYLGRCLEEMGKQYKAFQEYSKVIDSYPNSVRINEVVERLYVLGEYFLNRQTKKWLGISRYEFIEHPSIEIFNFIVTKVPYTPQAPKAQYKLGLLLMELGRYRESRSAFEKVIANYPESEWTDPAKYQLAIATAKSSAGEEYDSTALREATVRLKEFIKQHPDAEITEAATEQFKEFREREAKKNFDIAQFYEKQRKFKSAKMYYKTVIKNYPESPYAQKAKNRIENLADEDDS